MLQRPGVPSKRASHSGRSGQGAPPGTLTIDPQAPFPVIQVLAFGPDGFVERTIRETGEIQGFLDEWPVTWINVDGLGDEGTLRELGEIFGLHRLTLEDVVNVVQRPKLDEYDGYLYFVVHMIARADALQSEQVSLFLGDRFVLTFQERSGDCLEPVRERIRKKRPRLLNSGPDYLAYAILDAVVDGYFPVLEQYGESLESLQEEVIHGARKTTMESIYITKRDLVRFRRKIWPLRDVFASTTRDSTPLIADDTRKYLRDCADHTAQAIDLVESAREMTGSLMDLYLSSMGNRMNEIMKVLTIFAAIFIPLTFVAGIYGMNFDPGASPWNMPELGWAFGYPFALLVMGVVAGAMLFYFRRKGWL